MSCVILRFSALSIELAPARCRPCSSCVLLQTLTRLAPQGWSGLFFMGSLAPCLRPQMLFESGGKVAMAQSSTIGVLLELFHGRKSPDEELNDWGSSGPVLGPFRWIHT